jgi:monoamine oxidase
MPDAEVQAALMRRLRLQHPTIADTIPEPTAFFISRHGYDPLSWGAYSISHAGWKDAHHQRMAQPLTACGGHVRVRLAGEAMCDNLNGYTHGAFQSGKESAARYLHQHGLGPNPAKHPDLSLCDF